jgi:hypothetical protein
MTSTINASTTAGIVTTADTSGVLALQTAGTTALTVDASQNVGIGTASPATYGKLVSLGADNATTFAAVGATNMLRVQGYNSTYVGTVLEAVNLAQSANTPLFINGSTIRFGISGTTQTTIDSSGNVGIGLAPTYKLDVNGSIRTNNVMYVLGGDGSIQRSGGNTWIFLSSNTGYNSNGYHMKLDSSTSAGFASFFTVATETIRFDGSGNASKSSGAGSWLALSDKRIKENIVPVENGLQRICLLKPSTFDYKQPNAHQGKLSDKGFIADDFSEVYPNSIVETDFIAEDDKQYFEEGSLAKSMGFNAEFYADLVAAIQEQQALITQLQADVAALKGTTP